MAKRPMRDLRVLPEPQDPQDPRIPHDRHETPAAGADPRLRTLLLLRHIDQAWGSAFQESGFSDLYFSRLFTELWLRGDAALTKTDAYGLVKGVGLQTAIKYVRRAIEEGYLEERDHPSDGRSRLVRMTPRLRRQFEAFIEAIEAGVHTWMAAGRPVGDTLD